MKKVLIVLAAVVFLSAENKDLGTITVNDSEEESIFSEQDYIELPSYLENSPLQKRMSTKEAMNLPGIQGDPIKAVKMFSGVTSTSDSSGEMMIHASKPRESSLSINHLPVGYIFIWEVCTR